MGVFKGTAKIGISKHDSHDYLWYLWGVDTWEMFSEISILSIKIFGMMCMREFEIQP